MKNLDLKKKLKGFTLLEVLLSISLVSLIAGFSVPVFGSILYRSEVETATALTVTSLRSASIMARAQKNDSNWGVNLGGSTITIYSGSSFASRDVSLDQTYTFDGVSFGGTSNVNFASSSGLPSGGATISVNGVANNTTIIVNNLGIITY
jgi:prepilin-type N-terminal cleavage/methylation domain-containing protein